MGGFWAVWGYKWKVQGKGVKYDVVGSGRGSAWGGSPLPPPSPPCGMVRVRVFLRWFPLFFKSALGVWYTYPYDDNDENSDDDHHHHHHPHH